MSFVILLIANIAAVLTVDADQDVTIEIEAPTELVGDNPEDAVSYINNRFTWWANGVNGPTDAEPTRIDGEMAYYRGRQNIPFSPRTVGFSHNFEAHTVDITFRFTNGDQVIEQKQTISAGTGRDGRAVADYVIPTAQ